MPQSTFAGVATAIFTLMTAMVVTVGAIMTYITARAARKAALRAEIKMEAVREQTIEIHTIVNQQRTDMQRYIRAQTALLILHGIEPPIDQSLED